MIRYSPIQQKSHLHKMEMALQSSYRYANKNMHNIAAHNSFVVQMNVTTYFHVGIWCVLEFGRSPGLSSWLLTPSHPMTVVFVIHSELQLRDSDGITPFFPIKPSRSLAPILTRYVIFTNYNIIKI